MKFSVVQFLFRKILSTKNIVHQKSNNPRRRRRKERQSRGWRSLVTNVELLHRKKKQCLGKRMLLVVVWPSLSWHWFTILKSRLMFRWLIAKRDAWLCLFVIYTIRNGNYWKLVICHHDRKYKKSNRISLISRWTPR